MTATFQIFVFLLIVVAAVAVVAKRTEIPPPILLVLVGLVLALVPGLPTVELAPEFVLLIILPPVVYSSAVAMSWREFRFNLRPISLLAVGYVVFTTVAVAAAAKWFLGLPWPVGFVLGAIVSPPDPVAPLSIARRLHLPKRLLVVLEGEGLANDATALVLYRFAIAAVSVSSFSLDHALGVFATIIVGELAWGIFVGWAMLHLRRWAHDPRVEIILSILTPFLAYWVPELLGGSGVLATVTAGLYISWNGLRLISPATRLQGIFFWDFLIYVTEGMVFLVTGLQARALIAGIGSYRASELVLAGAIVSGVMIATRFIWVYPVVYLPRWLIPSLRRRDPSPPWEWTFALAYTGIRGIVSLAAALAIPVTTQSGVSFPDRDLIIFLAFFVILVTLVGQGLTLPYVVRWLGLANAGRRESGEERAEELTAWRRAIEAALDRLDRLEGERDLSPEIVAPLRAQYRDRLDRLGRRTGDDDEGKRRVAQSDEIGLLLIEVERDLVNKFYREGRIKDEARRRIERSLDLRHSDFANRQLEE
jgi:monovalent cation/hydrogen antiporter